MSFEQGSREALMGSVGEVVVVAWILASDNPEVLGIVHVSETSKKAAMFRSISGEDWIAPDLLLFTTRGLLWIDVKTWAAPVLNRWSNKMVHGVKVRHMESYKYVRDVTKAQADIFIVECSTQNLYRVSLDEWEEHAIPCMCPHEHNGGCMSYCPVENMQLITTLDAPALKGFAP